MMQKKPIYIVLAISLLLMGGISFAASNSSLNVSAVVSQSYTPPKYLSVVIGIILIVVVIFVGLKFLKDVVKTILVLILLFILASVAYSFFTTGTLTLSGVSGLINSIIGFFKDIVGASHTVTSVINSTGKAVGAVSNVTKALNKT